MTGIKNRVENLEENLLGVDGQPTEITIERVITDDGLTGTVVYTHHRTYPDGRRETIEEEPKPWRGKGKEELV